MGKLLQLAVGSSYYVKLSETFRNYCKAKPSLTHSHIHTFTINTQSSAVA